MNTTRNCILTLAMVGLAVTGCTSLRDRGPSADQAKSGLSGLGTISGTPSTQDSNLTRSQILIRSGVEFLRKGEIDKAQEVFNTALKFDIDNASLHFLNALTYHQGYLRGDADKFELAKAGYHTALQRDSSLDEIAYLQLGRLYLDARDAAAAKQAFAMSVDANRQSADALYGLAQAAALDGDEATSYWATGELDRIKWNNPDLYRLKAMQAALARQPERAHAYAADYTKATEDREDAKYVRGRVNQLLAIKTSLDDVSGADTRPKSIALEETRPKTAASAKTTVSSTSKPMEKAADSKPASPTTDEPDAPQIKKWFRCDKSPEIPARAIVNAGVPGANDENITTGPLPAPCPGETPRTAVIDVTMIQTQETKGRNFGINLLQGLSAIFTLQRARTFTQSTNVHEEVQTNNFVIANAVDNTIDVLRYSLNIANAAYIKNDVVARPSLAAIDRVPAVFFSGATITLGIAGVGGGASTVVDKPVGVSLTVTPTFIDDDNVLLSMRATRSFIETNLVPAGTSVLLQQSRNSISASSKLKFGETFVVSGLMAQQNTLSESGTPLLQDVPLLQYLFKQSEKLDTSLQIITLITLRRTPGNDATNDSSKTGQAGAPHKLSATVNEYVRLQSLAPVTDDVLNTLAANHHEYRQLRDKDVVRESTGSQSKLPSILDEFKEMIY
ncbi:MAG TPA: hypothetical protein VIF60_02040 [Burkholderiaceae bacterium]